MDSRSAMASLDDEDESVRIAVRALDDMRNGSYTNRTQQPAPQPEAGPAFVSRMSSIPLLKSALTVYEQGKASSRVVKYGAEMMESSVKTLSKPVINRLPVNVNQLDEFACRQLDRFDRYRRPSASDSTSQRPVLEDKPSDNSAVDDSESFSSQHSTTSDIRSRRAWKEGGERGVPSWIESTSSFASSSSRAADERSSTPTQPREGRAAIGEPPGDTRNDQQVAQRSRWQAMLLEAGGLSAALSEDSMRRLKYCLQWLQYATAHIDAQILILREFTASLQSYPPDAPPHARRPNPISEEHMRKLAEVRKDIVQTVRQVVDVVSKYAGGALPEPARGTVRGFILKLPQRWASKAGAVPHGANGASIPVADRDSVAAAASGAPGRRNGARRVNRERGTGASEVASPGRSGASSAGTSPAASPRLARTNLAPLTAVYTQSNHARHTVDAEGHLAPPPVPGQPPVVSQGAAIVTAERVLSLATESLDMMRGVTGVVKDSLDRAELWIARLRTVGLQRNGQDIEPEDEGQTPRNENQDANEFAMPDHFLQHRGRGGSDQGQQQHQRQYHGHHRRHSSSQFSDDMYSDTMPPSPFFSQAGSTSTWNSASSSIPSTPAGSGMYTPPVYGASPDVQVIGQANGMRSPGLGGISLSVHDMTLASRTNTPRSVAVEGLEEVDEDISLDGGQVQKGGEGERRHVMIVGLDDARTAEGEQGKMDVDGGTSTATVTA